VVGGWWLVGVGGLELYTNAPTILPCPLPPSHPPPCLCCWVVCGCRWGGVVKGLVGFVVVLVGVVSIAK
jgi:hypothetical protein